MFCIFSMTQKTYIMSTAIGKTQTYRRHHSQQPSRPGIHSILSKNWIDAVVVASISDKEVFMMHALPSYFRNILGLRYVYIVCNKPLCQILRNKKKTPESTIWKRIFIVPEYEKDLFPFTLEDVENIRLRSGFPKQEKNGLHVKNFHAWTFQQLLKLYSLVALSKSSTVSMRPKILPTVLVTDADTVYMRRLSFIRQPGQFWYSVSSEKTGAFPTDASLGAEHLKNLKGLGSESIGSGEDCGEQSTLLKFLKSGSVLNKGLIARGRNSGFTSITHHSIFQLDVIKLLLYRLQNKTCGFACSSDKNCSWERLATVKPFLSEYELYLSFVSTYFPTRVAFRSLPYVNAGVKFAEPFMSHKQNGVYRPVAYITMHDDYGEADGCCVNMSPTCATRVQKRQSCKILAHLQTFPDDIKCQHSGCCYDEQTKSCFQVECRPCNSGYKVVELSEAVLRMNGCHKEYFPAHASYSERWHQTVRKARKTLRRYSKCIKDGRILEEG